jgi:hypothetical protein
MGAVLCGDVKNLNPNWGAGGYLPKAFLMDQPQQTINISQNDALAQFAMDNVALRTQNQILQQQLANVQTVNQAMSARLEELEAEVKAAKPANAPLGLDGQPLEHTS